MTIWQKVNRFFERKEAFWKTQSHAGILGESKTHFEGKQTRLAKMEGLELKGDFEQRRSGWNHPEIKRLVLSADIQIASRRNVQYGSKRKKNGRKKENQKEKRERGGIVSNVCVSRGRRNGHNK